MRLIGNPPAGSFGAPMANGDNGRQQRMANTLINGTSMPSASNPMPSGSPRPFSGGTTPLTPPSPPLSFYGNPGQDGSQQQPYRFGHAQGLWDSWSPDQQQGWLDRRGFGAPPWQGGNNAF